MPTIRRALASLLVCSTLVVACSSSSTDVAHQDAAPLDDAAPTDGTSPSDGTPEADAAADTLGVCHGYCPKPDGSPCNDDCDCYAKCGVDARCGAETSKTIDCTADAGACPSGQSCVYGTCEGQACTRTTDCPAKQTCTAGACRASYCI